MFLHRKNCCRMCREDVVFPKEPIVSEAVARMMFSRDHRVCFSLAIFLAFLLFPTSGVFADNPDAETVWMVVRKSPPVPDPALSDYPDCNVALTVRLDDGKSVKLVVPAFRARVRSRAFEVGDRIRSAIRPFDRIDATVQQFPLVGDDEDFLMERYYAERPEKNGKAEVSASDLRVLHYSSRFIPCSREERLLLTEVKKGISDPERRAAFAAVAARINKCWKAEKNKFPKMSYFRYGVSGNGVFSLGDSHHFADSPGRGFYERTIPALFAMNHHLKKNGIRFLVVLVPDRNEIAVRALCPELRAEKSPVLQQQMEAFEKVGIEIVSAWDEFVNAIPDGLLFCYGSDPHLEANGVKILAKKTAEKLRGEIKPSLSGEFSVEQKNYVNRRWEFPIPCPIRKLEKGDKILSERLYLDGKPLCPNEAKDSEVLVCGNSFIGYPGFFAFSACLARELRCVPYHLERQSVGLEREIPRMLLTVPDLLKGRRVCVMVVDAARIDHGQWLDISERRLKELSRYGFRQARQGILRPFQPYAGRLSQRRLPEESELGNDAAGTAVSP